MIIRDKHTRGAATNESTTLSPSRCAACELDSPQEFRFCGHCGAPRVALRDATLTSARRQLSDPERRQLTVLFCDLVGSTSLSNRLDLETFRAVINQFLGTCTPIIRKFGGTVSRFMGDGFLVLFGYPRASELEAQQAVFAALEMIDSVARIQAPLGVGEPLAIRVGIATGLVVVGDLVGDGRAQELAVFGETANLAGRLQTIASPGEVVVAASTHRLLESQFDCESLGEQEIKGLSARVQPWRVRAARPVLNRFRETRFDRLTPLIARDDDLAWLVDSFRSAADGSGGVALLRGEAGIGKSRIVEALVERVVPELVHLQCSPHYANSALHPVIQLLESDAGIHRADAPDVRLDKLARLLGAVAGENALALAAALLAIPMHGRSALPSMTAQRQKELTFDLLVSLIERRAADQPLLVVWEDLHWIDPTSLEFLGLLAARTAGSHVLLVLTCRPEFRPALFGPHVRERELQKLSTEHTVALIVKMLGGQDLSADIVRQLAARSDGVPLFAEELTRFLVAYTRTAVATPTRIEIPATLHDLLLARLDQAGPSKFVAQLASAIGRDFEYPLLEAIAPYAPARLREGLAALEREGIVYPSGPSRYGFKHALVQEAAYQTLLRDQRRELHRRIADALVERFPGTAEAVPELLAYHWTQGEDPRAVPAWLAAGERSSSRSEFREAVGHLRKGIDLVALAGDRAESLVDELKLLLALGPPLIMVAGAGTVEVARVYSRAQQLCERLPKSELHFATHWGRWRTSMDHRAGRGRADELLALAEELGDPDLVLQAHHCQWATLYMLGAHEQCCEHALAGLAIYDPQRHRSQAATYGGHDVKVCALGELALSRWLMGDVDDALAHVNAALDWADKIAHVGSRVHAMDYALQLHRCRNDAVEVARYADAMIMLAGEQHLDEHRAKATLFRGWARAKSGDPVRALAEMRAALASESDAATPEDFPQYFEMFAEVCAQAGCFGDGLAAIDRGLAQAERGALVFWSAELLRRRGELLLGRNRDHAAAERCFSEAIECARGQRALSFELRAGMSLVRLRHGSAESLRALRSIVARFRQGHASADLVEARELLAGAAA